MWMLSCRSCSSSMPSDDTRGVVRESVVDRLASRLSALVGDEVELERPKDPSHGDFATSVALRTAKAIGKPPRELAAELAERVTALEDVATAEVAGPGFLNLRLADRFFVEALGE